MPLLETDTAIEQLLRNSKTIAVVGLSDKVTRDSHRVASYMHDKGYTIIPVNPANSSAIGLKSYPDLASIPVPVDIVDIFRRPEFVPAIVEDAIKIGAKAIWMQLGIAHETAAARASAAGLHVVVDRCILIEHRRHAL